MQVHFDLTALPLGLIALAHLGGLLGFETAVVLLLALGLPYSGPPN